MRGGMQLMPEEEPRRRLHHHRDPSYPVPLGSGGFDGDEAAMGGELVGSGGGGGGGSLSNAASYEQAKGDKRKAKCPRRSPMF